MGAPTLTKTCGNKHDAIFDSWLVLKSGAHVESTSSGFLTKYHPNRRKIEKDRGLMPRVRFSHNRHTVT